MTAGLADREWMIGDIVDPFDDPIIG